MLKPCPSCTVITTASNNYSESQLYAYIAKNQGKAQDPKDAEIAALKAKIDIYKNIVKEAAMDMGVSFDDLVWMHSDHVALQKIQGEKAGE